MRKYLAFFLSQKVEIDAFTSYEAYQKAVALFKPSKAKKGLVAVVLADVPVNPASL